jgi:hypothetical protein
LGEVGVDTGEVDRGAREQVLETRLGQPPVAGSAQAAALDGLGDGPFYSSADLVALLPLVGLLERAGLLKFAVRLAAVAA